MPTIQAKNHSVKFDKELKIKTDFAVRTWMIVACFISFIIYSCKYLIISSLLKCMRQKPGTVLCAYYVCDEHPWSGRSSKGLDRLGGGSK